MNDKFRSDDDIKKYLDSTAQGGIDNTDFEEDDEPQSSIKDHKFFVTSMFLIIGGIVFDYTLNTSLNIHRLILAISAGVSLLFFGYFLVRANRKHSTFLAVLNLIISIIFIFLFSCSFVMWW